MIFNQVLTFFTSILCHLLLNQTSRVLQHTLKLIVLDHLHAQSSVCACLLCAVVPCLMVVVTGTTRISYIRTIAPTTKAGLNRG